MMYNGPTFICIGAQKAGTTWLYENLSRHPDVVMPPMKEIHYFDCAYGLVFGVDNGSLHHISGDGLDNVFLLAPYLIDIA